jgi:hypothetical protein
MKVDDKIICDNGTGYELGYFIGSGDMDIYGSYKVNIVTGKFRGKCYRNKHMIQPYDAFRMIQLQIKYGYCKSFND